MPKLKVSDKLRAIDARTVLALIMGMAGIPAIVLDPTPITPPDYSGQSRYDPSYSPQVHEKEESTPKRILSTEIISPTSYFPSGKTHALPVSDLSNSNSLPSPSFYNSPTRSTPRPESLGRQPSNSSYLSSDDAHYRRYVSQYSDITIFTNWRNSSDSKPDENLHAKDYDEGMSDSMWGGKLHCSVEQDIC